MSTRTKRIVVVQPTETEALEAMRLHAQADSELKKLEGLIEIQVQKIRDKYKGKIALYQQQKADTFDQLNAYAEGNKEDLFSKTKSLDMTHGKIGFRTGMHKIKKPAKLTYDAIVKLMDEAKLSKYIRTKREVNKEAIIADRSSETLAPQLEKLGIQVVQDETFFVDIKEEELQ